MGWANKALAIAIVGGLLIAVLKEWVLWIVLLLIVLWLIRLFADLFWWGKDNDKW